MGIDLEELLAKLRTLLPSQQKAIDRLVDALARPREVSRDPHSDFATADFVQHFGDALVRHHVSAGEKPFTKEKFEHETVEILRTLGHDAEKVPGQRPRDITVAGRGWSMKTQADSAISAAEIHISKFMELGKGKWETEEDLAAMRDRMLEHMADYDRIFTLRSLSANQRLRLPGRVQYELVEIPKSLLLRARDGQIRMVHDSRQSPKPGYCTVVDVAGRLLFHLYFDGGTERKLQVTHLAKLHCQVHATWSIQI